MERLDDKESQALYSGKLALLNLDRKRYAEARPWCERELALAKEVKRPDLLAQAQIALARVLEYEGDYAEALTMAEQALALRERMGQTGLKAAHELVNRLRHIPH
jgi:tetratricopeptide (TPR) repeat protein